MRRHLVWKNDSGARELEGLRSDVGAAPWRGPHPGGDLACASRALDFVAPLADGQKTGWFYDQTANRERLRRYLPAGARVLDVCSYVGAWAVTALQGGAAQRHLRGFSATALDSPRAMPAPTACRRDDSRRCLRRAQGAAGAGRAFRRA